jgi:hypothetical protein
MDINSMCTSTKIYGKELLSVKIESHENFLLYDSYVIIIMHTCITAIAIII